jgi:hygromycin-B 7''-O-kinase
VHPLDLLDDLDHYRQLFTDAALWTPYIKEVCRRHNLSPDSPVRTGVPGTCPTFITGERWVVKFFGRLFDGEAAFQVEREAGRLATLDPAIPAAAVVAQGELGGAPTWPWPYLVSPFLPGRSIGEQAGQVGEEDWLRIAREMGEIARRLHALPLRGSPVFPDSHDPYFQFLQERRDACTANHRQWGSLPERLVAQIVRFLPPLETLVDRGRPAHLIHADLTEDHLLGRIVDGRWQTLGLIDFGDAMTGDLLYELGALQTGMFHRDRRLLRAFLDSYGLSLGERKGLAGKAMATALLHQFDLFNSLPEEILRVETLEALAERIWGEPLPA